MNIGKYSNWTDTLMGEGGKLDLSFWALTENLDKAKKQFTQAKPMLHCFEHWFGKYPWYEDSYKLVETPFLGMEHQSAIAYGNGYKNGYLGNDLSGTGWGLKWDFIIVHESGHEWFGNNITTKDLADMWVHEGFTNYSETLYTEWLDGKKAGYEYNYGLRKNISNDKNVIGIYGVNEEGSGDMYAKGANLIHTIRNAINDDVKFRNILRGLNKTFYHQTVTTNQVEEYISKESGINFSKVFDQYLRTIQIPVLEYSLSKNQKELSYRWTNAINGFNLRPILEVESKSIRLSPNHKWKKTKFKTSATPEDLASIEKNYYIALKQVTR
jgi:aminopeptidase N